MELPARISLITALTAVTALTVPCVCAHAAAGTDP